MEVQIAVEKVGKYASSESGDTVEFTERPGGGISVVLADGQSSGHGAKRVSNLVARKVINLLSEGVRDGAAARAASDFLYAERKGKVSATLNILSVDMVSRTLVISRNNPAPALVYDGVSFQVYDQPCQVIGLYRNTRPHIVEVPLGMYLTVCVYTDGLVHAGTKYGEQIQTIEEYRKLVNTDSFSPQDIADRLLRRARELDRNRPSDDISVVVLRVREESQEDQVRRVMVRLPLPLVNL